MKIVYYLLELAMLFAGGSVFGWCIEVVFRRFSPDNKERVWINPGFLNGPCLPLYGFALLMLYFMALLEKYLAIDNDYIRKGLLFVLMSAAITLVELFAGEIFIVHRHLKLWDYTDMRFHYKGIICPRYSFYWAMLGAGYYFFIHPHIITGLEWFSRNPLFSFFIGMFYGVLLVDLIISFEITDKVKAFAEEHRMVIRYEELKKHIRLSGLPKKGLGIFMRLIPQERSLKEMLMGYLEKQRENAKSGRLNDFIDDKFRFGKNKQSKE